MAILASTKVVMKNCFWDLDQECCATCPSLHHSASEPALHIGGLLSTASQKTKLMEQEESDSDDDRSTAASSSGVPYGRSRFLSGESWADSVEADASEYEAAPCQRPPGNFASAAGPPGVFAYNVMVCVGPPGVLLPDVHAEASSDAEKETPAAKTEQGVAAPTAGPPGNFAGPPGTFVAPEEPVKKTEAEVQGAEVSGEQVTAKRVAGEA